MSFTLHFSIRGPDGHSRSNQGLIDAISPEISKNPIVLALADWMKSWPCPSPPSLLSAHVNMSGRLLASTRRLACSLTRAKVPVRASPATSPFQEDVRVSLCVMRFGGKKLPAYFSFLTRFPQRPAGIVRERRRANIHDHDTFKRVVSFVSGTSLLAVRNPKRNTLAEANPSSSRYQ